MTKKAGKPEPPKRAPRREFTEEFRREAVQMMLDGHTAASVAGRLGLSGTNLLYRWKREQLERTGPVATSQPTTDAPSRANATAAARPMLPPVPVITQTLPASLTTSRAS